jgi:hypothetical protein
MVGGRSVPPVGIQTTRGHVDAPGSDHYGEVESVPMANAAVRRDIAAHVLEEGCTAVSRRGLRVLFNPWMIADRASVPASAP